MAMGIAQIALLLTLVILVVYRDTVDTPVIEQNELSPSTSTAQPLALDEEVIRRVVREELARLPQYPVALAGDNDSDGVDRFESEPREQRRTNTERREVVAGRIDQLRAIGSMTQHDFEQLQEDIARLAPEDRQQMLNRIARAINLGEVRATLR